MLRIAATLATLVTAAVPAKGPAAVMVTLPGGTHQPLHGKAVTIRSFRLDRDPVTRADFLMFVRANPQWRRSAISGDAADRSAYLSDWRADLDPGSRHDLLRPVTAVSWHAARAYCSAQGKRLPTLLEWEHAAAASRTRADGSRDDRFVQHLLTVYATRSTTPKPAAGAEVNVHGVRALHDRVWEWVADPNEAVGALHHATHHHARGRGRTLEAHDMTCAGAALGAADPSNYPAFLRAAMRSALTDRTSLPTLGFRCAS